MKRRPSLTIDHDKLRLNMRTVADRCAMSGIDVAGDIDMTGGTASVAKDFEACGVRWIASSRLEQLARVKASGVTLPLLLTRTPMISELDEVLEICDCSFQSEFAILRALDERAIRTGKIHDVILIADPGDRNEISEGFTDREEFLAVAKHTDDVLSGLRLIGIGAHAGGATYGIGGSGYYCPDPDTVKDKMTKLSSYAEAIETRTGRILGSVAAIEPAGGMAVPQGKTGLSRTGIRGSSHTEPDFPTNIREMSDSRINVLVLGVSVYTGESDYLQTVLGSEEAYALHRDAFTLEAEIIEIKAKPVGRRVATLAVGRSDFGSTGDILPVPDGAEVIGATENCTMIDISGCSAGDREGFRAGSAIALEIRRSAVLRLINSENISVYEI